MSDLGVREAARVLDRLDRTAGHEVDELRAPIR
jgi:hypothetical protein